MSAVDDDLPEIEEMPPTVSELMMWASGSDFDTVGCRCGHEGCGPSWHLSDCPWPARAWRHKARELALRLDEVEAIGMSGAPSDLVEWESDDDAPDAEHDGDAVPIDIDEYGATQPRYWKRGFVDGLLFKGGCGPYSDGSWRSTHPQVSQNREESQ